MKLFNIELPTIFKNSAIYTFVQFLQKGVGFFLLPLYTAMLTPADYGVLNIVTSLSTFLSILILLGLQGAASRYYFENTNIEYRKELWGTITTFVIITSLVVGGVVIVFHKFLIDPIIGDIPFYPYLLLGIINTVLSPLYVLFQHYLNTRQEAAHYGINTFLNFLVGTGLIILFLTVQGKGAQSVLTANIVTSLIFLTYVIIYFIPRVKMGIKKETLKHSLNYSLPLVPHLLSNASSGMIDRFLINGIRSESEAGLYSVGNQFGSIVHTITNAVNTAFSPWFLENVIEKKNENGQAVQRFSLFCTILYSFIALGISLFAPEVLQILVTEDFREVWTLIPFLCFAYVFQGLYLLFVNVLFIKDTKYVFIVSFSALAANVLLNLLLVPTYGFMGAGIACFLTFFIKSVLALVLSFIRVKTMRFPWLRMYLIVWGLLVITFINYITIDMSCALSILVKLGITVGAAFPFYLKYKDFIKALITKK